MVLAPESELVQQLTTADQKAEVDAYLDRTKKRTERERIADRQVTGVFSGSYAINPFTGEAVPIWISDYVLAGYGTGAIMAVPAHDSRDYAFAKHFGLEIRPFGGRLRRKRGKFRCQGRYRMQFSESRRYSLLRSFLERTDDQGSDSRYQEIRKKITTWDV